MIMKSHRRDARAAHADRDAGALFGFAIDCDRQRESDVARWGAGHKRYARIYRSLQALVRELSLELDAENDLGLRSE